MAAVKAFREPYITSDTLNQDNFSDFGARQLRYAIFWSFYENSAYRDTLHAWSKAYKTQYGLYRYIRNIYNPAYRLIEFHVTHLWGGALDPDAGDGVSVPSALPIQTSNEALRPAIAQLWRDSNWQVRKDTITRQGACFGDFAIRVVDDTSKGKVYLEQVHPGTIKDVILDAYNFVKGYTLEEQRDNPDGKGQKVTYAETARREDDNVIFCTYLNGKPYPWNGVAAEWAEPYGFVPLVVGQHNDVGLDWGWSEMHAARPKIHEADDLASKLHDQIRKAIDPIWFFKGVRKPTSSGGSTIELTASDPTNNKPQPGREEIPALYGPAESDAKALITEINIADTAAEINAILEELERDYPELKDDIFTASGDASGRALRTARQGSESKIRQRRPNYDNTLVRAQQMSVAIGGYREYDGYQGFGLDSFDKGALDHNIAKRPVFAQDPLDDIEVKAAFWAAIKSGTEAGGAIDSVLSDMGWDDAKIAKFMEAHERQQSRQAELDAVRNQGNATNALGVMGAALRSRRQTGAANDTQPAGPGQQQGNAGGRSNPMDGRGA